MVPMEMVLAVSSGCVGEVGCGDEDAPGGSVGVEAAGEVPDLGFADLVGPAFGLHVESVEAEDVLVDGAVDVSVSGASDVAGVSVAHVFQEVEDGVLEAVGAGIWMEGVEEVGGEAVGLSRSEWGRCALRSEWGGVRSERGRFDRLRGGCRRGTFWVPAFAGTTVGDGLRGEWGCFGGFGCFDGFCAGGTHALRFGSGGFAEASV